MSCQGETRNCSTSRRRLTLLMKPSSSLKYCREMQIKCIVPFVKDLVSNQPKSRTRKEKKKKKKRQKEQRKESVERRKKSTGNLLSLILKSTPSQGGSYHILDGGDFLKPFVTKSNLNIENLNSKNVKPRFHLQPLRELLAKGYVDNHVIEDLKQHPPPSPPPPKKET